jgi:hypothetical protein
MPSYVAFYKNLPYRLWLAKPMERSGAVNVQLLAGRRLPCKLTVNNNTFCFATIDKVFYYVASALTTHFGPY